MVVEKKKKKKAHSNYLDLTLTDLVNIKHFWG